MSDRVLTIGTILLYVFSIGVGFAWWFVVLRNDVLAQLPPPGSKIVAALGAIQLLGFVVILVAILQSLRGFKHTADMMTLALSAALLFANLAWLVTPILGGLLILLVAILGILRLFIRRRSALVH